MVRSYVLDDKMRTNYSWKAVEPILEMRKIGESYHRVGVAHYASLCPILEPRPIVCTPGFAEKDDMHPIRGLGSSQKIFKLFKPSHKYTLPLSSFQNGIIELLSIIISDSTYN